jgi:hypothetical protein
VCGKNPVLLSEKGNFAVSWNMTLPGKVEVQTRGAFSRKYLKTKKVKIQTKYLI